MAPLVPKRVLPDTNLWLDAAFSEGSVARRALAVLKDKGVSVIVEPHIEHEALMILEKIKKEMKLRPDLRPHFLAFIGGYLRVERAPRIKIKVNNADVPVASAAQHYNAMILTQDAPLIDQCLSAGLQAQFPWQLMTNLGIPLSLEEVIRVVPPGRKKGTIFARVDTTWGGAHGGRYTVCDIENVGRLWIDGLSLEWVFDSVASVRMHFPEVSAAQSMIAVTYALPGQIILRAFAPGTGTKAQNYVHTQKRIAAESGRITFGHSLANDEHLNGHIRHLTISPEGMSVDRWKIYCRVPDAAPNPVNKWLLKISLTQFG